MGKYVYLGDQHDDPTFVIHILIRNYSILRLADRLRADGVDNDLLNVHIAIFIV